jgi:hypothetical protein
MQSDRKPKSQRPKFPVKFGRLALNQGRNSPKFRRLWDSPPELLTQTVAFPSIFLFTGNLGIGEPFALDSILRQRFPSKSPIHCN